MKTLISILTVILFIACSNVKLKKDVANFSPEYKLKFIKYKDVIINVNKNLNDIIIKIQNIQDTSLIKSMYLTGIVSYRVIIDKNGKVEDAILLNSINPTIDSLVYKSIKKSRFKKVVDIFRRRIKYSILMTFRFENGNILSPLINGVPFNSSKKLSEEEKIWEFFSLKDKPVLLNKPYPIYPAIERKKGKQGITVVTMVIDKNGFVEYAEIFRSLGPVLDNASIDAAMRCRFQPGRHNGRPVKVKMNIPFKFILKSQN